MCDLIKLFQEQRIRRKRKNNQSLFHKPFLLQDNVKFFLQSKKIKNKKKTPISKILYNLCCLGQGPRFI